MDYRGARFYDADVGRFLSLDSLAADFPSWSDYNYVYNNPIAFIDPTGKGAEVVETKEGYELRATIYLYDNGTGLASEDVAKKYQQIINDMWNSEGGVKGQKFQINGKDVTFKIKVKVGEIGDFKKRGIADNFALVSNTDGNSKVVGNTMIWNLEDDNSKGNTAIPHEVGHMLGFKLEKTYIGPGDSGVAQNEWGAHGLKDDTHFRYNDGNSWGNHEPKSPLPLMSSDGGFTAADRVATYDDFNRLNKGRGVKGTGAIHGRGAEGFDSYMKLNSKDKIKQFRDAK